jgi:hypothetical protein
MVRTTLGAEVDTTVTVSGSESVNFIEIDQTGSVSPNTAETTLLTAPQGSVIELLGAKLGVRQPSAPTSGTHRLQVRSAVGNIEAVFLESNHNTRLLYDTGLIQFADVRAVPTTEVAQQQAIRGYRADSTNGINLRYVNVTDAAISEKRKYRLWTRQIEVAD